MRELIEILPVTFSLIFGAVYCFFGYKFLKIQLVAAGFYLGFNLVYFASANYLSEDLIFCLIGGVIGSFVGAALFLIIYRFALFSIGSAAGTLLGPIVLQKFPPIESRTIYLSILAAVAILGGLAASFLRRQILIFFTSTFGAFITVVSLNLIWQKNLYPNLEDVVHAYEVSTQELWWGILALAIAGIGAQFRSAEQAEEISGSA